MKKIRLIILILILIFGFNNQIFGQEIIDKLSRKLCKCAEKQELISTSEMQPCFEELLINNLKDLKEYYNVGTIEELNIEEIGNKIGAKMIKECEYVVNTFQNDYSERKEKRVKQPNLKCEDLKNGDFYYLTEIPQVGISDTTFVTISDNLYLERMKNGRTFSLLEIKWKNNCKFDLEFKESNDPFKKELSKAGDIYEYEVIENGDKSIFIEMYWMDKSYQTELIKIK